MNITPRHQTLAALILEALEKSGTVVRKLDNRPANLGVTASLALAVQLAKLIDGEKP